MSCGHIALDRAGINVTNYYASEIDKYAEQVSNDNYPDIHRLGDVTKHREWNLPKIDLLIGGSPCQGFSFAGNQMNFGDPRSQLFFEFVNILKTTKPKYFLLENVCMKKEYVTIISDILGVKPITINSQLVSAQNRKRLYWTNIPNVEQPADMKIKLEDVILHGIVDRDKSYCIDASYYKGGNLKSYFTKRRRQLVFAPRPCEVREFKHESICHHAGTATDIKGSESIKRIYAKSGKSPTMTTMTTMCGGHRQPKLLLDDEISYRKLFPIECERLQTVPDNYTESVSNTQRYKMLGNGWTVDVIAHIFKGLNNDR